MSERSDRLIFLSFRIQPPWRPRERGPEPKDKAKSEGSEKVNFIDLSDIALSFGSGSGPFRGACKGPIPNGPENYLVGPFGHGLLQAP